LKIQISNLFSSRNASKNTPITLKIKTTNHQVQNKNLQIGLKTQKQNGEITFRIPNLHFHVI